MVSIRTQQKNAFDTLKDTLGIGNRMETPRVEKIVLSAGVGKIIDKEQIALIEDRLAKIAGQKAAPRQAKKSIASFKVREGDIVGYQVTLRGSRRDAFLDKLINIALPRMRDFRGISTRAVDEMGNLTIGVREHTIFPETSDEELRNVFGLSVTLTTTATNKEEAIQYLKHIGIPFKDDANTES